MMRLDEIIMWALMWSTLGLAGSRWIHCLWFSGGLRDLRKDTLSPAEIVLGVFFGPVSVVIGTMFWAAGMGRRD